uniref:Uncharacterized protein n=1 Tax=Entomoneis paludosa TaxID=265537 RepID=A0A7S2YC89_9STRA
MDSASDGVEAAVELQALRASTLSLHGVLPSPRPLIDSLCDWSTRSLGIKRGSTIGVRPRRSLPRRLFIKGPPSINTVQLSVTICFHNHQCDIINNAPSTNICIKLDCSI